MFAAVSPSGTELLVPENAGEDAAYFHPDEVEPAARFYAAEGYVVVRGLVSRGLCDDVRAAFEREVRRSAAPILRQQNMRYERNRLDARGFLANPIFNVQDLETRRFGVFKRAALDVLTSPRATRLLTELLCLDRAPEAVKLIQSMFFEGGVGTWPHQDTYYQDSASELGGCVAGWFALEDIAAGAGRFYVVPRSHRELPVIRNEGELDFATGHELYKKAVAAAVDLHRLEWRAPWLGKGDVLFWSSRTVHGSLYPAPGCGGSRASLTAHYLRETDSMLQFHTRIREQDRTHHNGITVCRLHDQDRWRNRAVRLLASRCPEAWSFARRTAMRIVLRKPAGHGGGISAGLAAPSRPRAPRATA